MNVFKHLHRSWLRQSDVDNFFCFCFERSPQLFPLIFKSVCKTPAHPAGFQSCKFKRINRNNCLETLWSGCKLQLKQKPADLCSCWCLTRGILFYFFLKFFQWHKSFSWVYQLRPKVFWKWIAGWSGGGLHGIHFPFEGSNKRSAQQRPFKYIRSQSWRVQSEWQRETKVKQTKGNSRRCCMWHTSPNKVRCVLDIHTHTHTRGRERKGYIVLAITLCILRASSLK